MHSQRLTADERLTTSELTVRNNYLEWVDDTEVSSDTVGRRQAMNHHYGKHTRVSSTDVKHPYV